MLLQRTCQRVAIEAILQKIVVCPAFNGPPAGEFLVRTEHENRNVRGRVRYLVECLDAAAVGKEQIQDDPDHSPPLHTLKPVGETLRPFDGRLPLPGQGLQNRRRIPGISLD